MFVEREPVEEKLEAYLAEYSALREEIKWLIQEANQYQNFAIALIGATVTLIPWVLDKALALLIPVLLILPFLFSLLGFLYLREHEEVYVVGAYLREYLRSQVRNLVKDSHTWGWEEFKTNDLERYSAVMFCAFCPQPRLLSSYGLPFFCFHLLLLYYIYLQVLTMMVPGNWTGR